MKDRNDMLRRKAAFLVRTEQYLSLGHDRFAAVDFVVKTGGRLSGPALDIGTGKGLMAMAMVRQGFELVARVHQEEGREHPVSGVTLESAEAFLSGRGFELTARLSGHKHDVIVLTKTTGEGV
jgi:2-polyprenyl-3-methyl-5-hydroxy-6-metoxy-1,4-benzoquinol methylase